MAIIRQLILLILFLGNLVWQFGLLSLPRRLSSDPKTLLYLNDGFAHIARDVKLLYVHIPKTGGSTIERSSLFQEKRKLGGNAPKGHRRVQQLMKARHVDSSWTVATHIRHPCIRFVSAFHHIRHSKKSMGIQSAAKRFGLMDRETVEETIQWLDETNKWDKLKKRIFHFFNMLDWLMLEDAGEEWFAADIVMCQDDWDEGIERLYKGLHADDENGTLALGGIPDDLYKHILPGITSSKEYCEKLPQQMREHILDMYALDSCVFGYGKYGEGHFNIPDRNDTSICIGAQFDKQWFTRRYEFCQTKLKIGPMYSYAKPTIKHEQ